MADATQDPSGPMLASSETPQPQQPTPTPQPSGAQPGQATAALGGGQQPSGPVPQQQQPQQAAPNPAVQAKAAQTAHHSVLGRLAESLFTGQQTQYVPDPDHPGQVKATQVKDTKGQFFRSLVGGALMGMAAGAGQKDFAGGLGKGFEVNQNLRRAQDAQGYARAQQQVENTQKQSELDEQKKWREAQIAQFNTTNLRADAEFNQHGTQFMEEHNDRERAMQLQLDQMGAKPLPLNFGPNNTDINGKEGNGKILQKQGGTDLNSLQAPNGQHTVLTTTVNMDGLTYQKGDWINADGQKVNLEDRTTHTLYALPDNIWNEDSGIKTGKEFNAIAGFRAVDPDAKIHPTNGDVLAAKTKGQDMQLKAAQTESDVYKARLEAATAKKQIELAGKQADIETTRNMQAAYQIAKEHIDSLKSQLKERGDLGGDVTDLEAQLNDATDDLDAAYATLYPKTAKKPKEAPPKAPPAALTPDNFTKALTHAKGLPKDQAIQEIQSAQFISPDDKKKLIDALNQPSPGEVMSQAVQQGASGYGGMGGITTIR